PAVGATGRCAGAPGLAHASDAAACGHCPPGASTPQPSDGPDPSVAVPEQRARAVAAARQRHGSSRYRHEDDTHVDDETCMAEGAPRDREGTRAHDAHDAPEDPAAPTADDEREEDR